MPLDTSDKPYECCICHEKFKDGEHACIMLICATVHDHSYGWTVEDDWKDLEMVHHGKCFTEYCSQ